MVGEGGRGAKYKKIKLADYSPVKLKHSWCSAASQVPLSDWSSGPPEHVSTKTSRATSIRKAIPKEFYYYFVRP
jgi:hypothetical protein